MRKFHLGDVLSVTTGHLVSPRHMDGVYDILNYMMGLDLFTHQLPLAADICKPDILYQFPELSNIRYDLDDTASKADIDVWLSNLTKEHGEYLSLKPLGQ